LRAAIQKKPQGSPNTRRGNPRAHGETAAEGGRSMIWTSDGLWVVLYSILLTLLLISWASVPA
jgi:hypothetical protein